MTQELAIIPFSAFSHADKLSQAAWLLCITCRIESGKNHLVALIGRGDEFCNHQAIQTWLDGHLTEFDDEDLFIRQVERLTDKLLDRLTQFQNAVF